MRRIVFIGHTAMGGPFIVGSHHYSRICAAEGNHVLHLSTPITPFHLGRAFADETVRSRFRVWKTVTVRRDDRLDEAVPLTPLPWPVAGSVLRLTGKNIFLLTVPRIARLIASAGMYAPDFAFIDQPCLAGIERHLNAAVTIYRATDLYEEMTNRPTTALAERLLIHAVDGIVATSVPVLEHCRSVIGKEKPAMLLENGVEHAHFSKPASIPVEYEKIRRPKAIYVGAIDFRLDIDLIGRLASQKPGINFVVVGPMSRGIARGRKWPSNVHFLGARPYSDLPSYLQHADVGLLPLTPHPANEGRSPMKFFEYQAAGLPIVSSNFRELRRRKAPHVYFYDNRDDAGATLEQALDKSSGLEAKRSISASSWDHSWTKKTGVLLEFAQALLDAKQKQHREIAPSLHRATAV